MGSEVAWSGPRPLSVHARGYTELARGDILRDGEVVHTVRGEPPPRAGALRVDLRVEWGEAAVTTRWDGRLWVAGGQLPLPEFVGPEVVSMDGGSITWEHVAHSFGEPYGAQRGGVEVSVYGPPDAVVHLECAGRSVTLELARLAGHLAAGGLSLDAVGARPADLPGRLALRPAVGALLGLGVRELDASLVDDEVVSPGGTAFYYARVFQVDGEVAWSSPIWVDT